MLCKRSLSALWVLTLASVVAPTGAATTENVEEVVRIAELDIELAQIDAYRAALKEEIATSIAVEPGVLALYAVAMRDLPDQIRIFERYANHAAYASHVHSAHFYKYKTATQTMVKSLKLIETSPIFLGTQAGQH
jgi:quinol monooxygenase YgiN